MRILHVTECYEGGVRRAIETLVRLTPEFEHLLLADAGQIQNTDSNLYTARISMAKGFWSRVRQTASVAEEMNADIIHAHSSWAGVYARMGTPPKPVVYEPHCFVFDDPNRGRLQRWVYKKAEAALGKKTAAVIALTPHEQALAEGIAKQENVVWLPNVPTIPLADQKKILPHSSAFEVVMVGRLARQKDPKFYADLFRSLQDHGQALKFTWIGDGESHYHKMLTDAGVEVTGWLNDKDLAARLSKASLYFHSASYEGFPLSVLDAAASGLPILARDLPSFKGFPLNTAKNVEDATRKICAYLQDPELQRDFLRSNNNLLTMMTPEAQRASLYQAYEIASGSRKEMHNCV